MTCYSSQPRDCIYVKDNGFVSFVENIGKNISDHSKQSVTDALKLVQREQFRKVQANC